MAEKKYEKTASDKSEEKKAYDTSYSQDFNEDLDAHNDAINSVPYDALEAMESAKVFDQNSRQTKNRLTDSMTDTIYRERAARVVGNLPGGVVRAFGKKDIGKGLFMDLLRTHWIYPNANAQHDLLDKLYMWKKKASVYNTVCMYVDKNVSPSGYEGPDCWLWNPRNTVPQRGKASINDMDYIHLIAFWSPEQFERELDDPDSQYEKGIIEELLPSFKGGEKGKDPDRSTNQAKDTESVTVKQVKVVTRYEAGPDGKWCTFLPDYGYKVIREIDNPHKNNRIPVVALTMEPEFDSWYGTSDYQRSMPLQAANDGLMNGYFTGMNKALNPRTFADVTTLVPQTWSDKPGSLVEFTGPFTVKTEEISTASLSNFQAVTGVVKGGLQTIAGTTQDTSLTGAQTSDPQFAKTPEGLRLRSEREATRDKQDRSTFERACKRLFDLMLSIIPTLPNKIPVDILEEDIRDIMRQHPDLGELITDENGEPVVGEDGEPMNVLQNTLALANQTGVATVRPSESEDQMRLRIDPQKLQGLEYRFELDPDSTAAQTKDAKWNAVKDIFAFYGTIQNVVQDYQKNNNMYMDLGVINEMAADLADLPELRELWKPMPGAEQAPQGQQPGEPGGEQPGEPGAQQPIPMTPESVSALANAPAPEQLPPMPTPAVMPMETAPQPGMVGAAPDPRAAALEAIRRRVDGTSPIPNQ